jgi:hypothetical protein
MPLLNIFFYYYSFRYDVAPLRVRVIPDAPPLWRFLLRLCAICGGVYASVGKDEANKTWKLCVGCASICDDCVVVYPHEDYS